MRELKQTIATQNEATRKLTSQVNLLTKMHIAQRDRDQLRASADKKQQSSDTDGADWVVAQGRKARRKAVNDSKVTNPGDSSRGITTVMPPKESTYAAATSEGKVSVVAQPQTVDVNMRQLKGEAARE